MIDSAPLDLDRHGLLLAAALAVIALQPPYPFLVGRAIRRGLLPGVPMRRREVPVWALGGALVMAAAVLVLPPAAPSPVLAALALILWSLALLDVRYLWLPDRITLPLLLAGLAAAWPDRDQVLEAAIGAVAGGGVFYAVHRGFRALRGYDGLGLGDVKLLAALGAWVGAPALAWLVLLASLSALTVVGASALIGRVSGSGGPRMAARIPFGAHLALAGWVMMCLRQGAGATL